MNEIPPGITRYAQRRGTYYPSLCGMRRSFKCGEVVLVFWPRTFPLRFPVLSKDCGDAPGHLPTTTHMSSSPQASLTTNPIWASALKTPQWAPALLPTTPSNLASLTAREGHTTTTPTSQRNSRPCGLIQTGPWPKHSHTGCSAPTTTTFHDRLYKPPFDPPLDTVPTKVTKSIMPPKTTPTALFCAFDPFLAATCCTDISLRSLL
ncbi:hypothetical protein F5888DRAFT_827001 [Russula emetica]|nr:hypothetical protein F5888DRAFT_827001 [Russula emetica]